MAERAHREQLPTVQRRLTRPARCLRRRFQQHSADMRRQVLWPLDSLQATKSYGRLIHHTHAISRTPRSLAVLPAMHDSLQRKRRSRLQQRQNTILLHLPSGSTGSAPCPLQMHHALWPLVHYADALSAPFHPFYFAFVFLTGSCERRQLMPTEALKRKKTCPSCFQTKTQTPHSGKTSLRSSRLSTTRLLSSHSRDP